MKTIENRVAKLVRELERGDKIVEGHMFPRTLYTGTVLRVEPSGDRELPTRIVCDPAVLDARTRRGGTWKCKPDDVVTVEVAP